MCSLWLSGAGSDAEQLALTDQFFDAALGELHAVALAYWLVISTWSPPNPLPGKRDFGWALG